MVNPKKFRSTDTMMQIKGGDNMEIDMDLIDISEFNTRKDMEAGLEDSSLEDLANSIKEKGLLNPVIIRSRKNGRFELIAGQRRFLACKKLQMKKIQALIRDDINDIDATIISLIENVHRADMHPIDKAKAFKQLYDKYQDYQKVSKETGVGIPTVKRYLSLLDLPDEIQRKISTSEGHIKIETLSMLPKTFHNKEEMIEVYEKIQGFTQIVQKEIIKQTGGDISKVDDLIVKAHEGVFDTHICRGINDCSFIPDELKNEIIKTLKNHKRKFF